MTFPGEHRAGGDGRRYGAKAYAFVYEAVERAIDERRGDVTGGELLETVRDVALERFGPMAKLVLEEWGVRRTEDVGRVVYDLIEAGILCENEGDSQDDQARSICRVLAQLHRGEVGLAQGR